MRFGPVLLGLLSAALFGTTTPLGKILLQSLSQFQLAGLLYLGAGLGTLPFVFASQRGTGTGRHRLDKANLARIGASIIFDASVTLDLRRDHGCTGLGGLSSVGSVSIVGIGPGDRRHMTAVVEAIEHTEVVVGYTGYLPIIGDLLAGKDRFGTSMRQELEKADYAIHAA